MGSKNYNPGRINPGRNPNSVLPVGWNQGFFFYKENELHEFYKELHEFLRKRGNYMSLRKEKNFLRVLTS